MLCPRLRENSERGGPVKLSFFGGISMGRFGTPEETPDGVLSVASLLDLAGTKAKVVLQRPESKDYLDLLAIFKSGINLSQAMAAARALYGEQYNPMLRVDAHLRARLKLQAPNQQCRAKPSTNVHG
jgi:hypothetical protein